MAREFLFSKIPHILVAAFAATAAAPAAGQTATCAPRAQMVEWLEQTFGELPGGFGLIGNHTVFEIHISEETGSWTVLTTNVKGRSCMVSAGHSWTPVDRQAEGASTRDAAERK